MITFIKKLFGIAQKPQERSFSDFFNHASPKEKTDLLRRVAREANADQKRMMEEAERAATRKTART